MTVNKSRRLGTLEKKFGSFTAELEPCWDRDALMCYVSKNGETSSLEWVSDFGEIDSGTAPPQPVPQRTIDKIEEWAMENGW